jgi:hypothetical protein
MGSRKRFISVTYYYYYYYYYKRSQTGYASLASCSSLRLSGHCCSLHWAILRCFAKDCMFVVSEKSYFESSDQLQILPRWRPSLELIRGFNSDQSPIFLKPNMQFLIFFCKAPNYWPSAVIKLDFMIISSRTRQTQVCYRIGTAPGSCCGGDKNIADSVGQSPVKT